MFRTVGISLLCLAMFSIAGGHWALLQTVAWAQMLGGEYSRGAALTTAVEKTFSGNHPCALCLKVQEGRANEDKAPAKIAWTKKAESFISPVYAQAPSRLVRDFSYPLESDVQFGSRQDAPPRPVPRSAVI
jgi:hypothetical protein